MTMAEMPAATSTAAAMPASHRYRARLAASLRWVRSEVRARVSPSIRLVVRPMVTTPEKLVAELDRGADLEATRGCGRIAGPRDVGRRRPVLIDGRTDGSGPRNRPRPA